MPATFRIATFNVENLFARYRFRNNLPPSLEDDGFTINHLAFEVYGEGDKRVTAQTIRELDADVLALQEVENLEVLDRFCARYLPAMGYRHRVLIDCHDPRHIDVALLSRFPIAGIRTHRHLRNAAGNASLFSRDCLEADVEIEHAGARRLLTVYVNHFKSMIEGRDATRARREEQVKAVARILDARWRPAGYDGNFVVLGDFNDYVDATTSLTELVDHKHLQDVVERLPEPERWTHYYAGKGQYKQLDYLLLGAKLDERANQPAPVVLRKGLPYRATKYTGPRFEDVGEDDPKASDHCPVAVDIPLAALA